MKYLITTITILFTLSSIPSLALPDRGYKLDLIESNDSSIRCLVTFDSVQILQRKIDGAWLTEISIPGCATTDQEGWPSLPTTSLVLGIPASGTPRLIVTEERSRTQSLGDLAPVAKSPSQNTPDAGDSALSVDMIGDGWYPAQLAQLGVCGFVRNQRIVQIELHPVRYMPAGKLTQIVRALQLRIEMAPDAVPASSAEPAFGKRAADTLFDPLLKGQLANYEAAKNWRASPKPAPVSQSVESSGIRNGFKLLVSEDGVYFVDGKALKKAGADLEAIRPAALAISNRGRPVPIIVEGEADGTFDEEDRIIFIGRHNSGDNSYLSFYSDTNVYWLSWESGVGARFAEVSGASDSEPDSLITHSRTMVHLEVDTTYQRLLYVNDDDLDHWFWQILSAGTDYEFPLPLDNARRDASLTIRLSLHGSTHPPASPDHHLVVKLNGQIVGEATWDNQTAYQFASNPISGELLRERNILTLSLPGDLPGANVDQVLLNWIEVDFDQELVAQDDSLRFVSNPAAIGNLRVEGFSSPKIYSLTDYGQRIIDLTTSKDNGSYSSTFKNRSTLPGEFFIVSEKKLKAVPEIIKDTPSDLHHSGNGADYLIITHRDFAAQAQKLANFRATQGLRTKVVDIEDVYDEFSYGIYDPRAIRGFLRYAYANWVKPSPLYVLLLGDTTHEMDKQIAHRRRHPSFIPAMMQYTSSWGMTATDNYFAAVSGEDLLPDMYVGRLPANTAEEAEIMVQKTIDYESKSIVDGWSRNVFLLTGTDEFFHNSAQYLYDHYIPKSIVTNFLTTDPQSRHFGSTEDVARYINSGQSIVNFIGHGGGGVYFDSELFLQEDIATLHNQNKYPVAFSMTCFIGHFDNPETPSLSEELLRSPDRGFVSHFGSAGRALLQGDFFLNNALFDAIFNRQARTMGEITTLAKYDMVGQTKSYWDHVKNYVLVGDPALQVRIAPEIVDLQLSKSALANGDQVSVNGQVRGFSSGTVSLSVFNEADSLLVSDQVTLQNGSFASQLFTMNSEFRKAWGKSGGSGIVRAYFSNGPNEGVGKAEFVVNRPVISEILLEPAIPHHLDSVFVRIRTDPQSIYSIGGIQAMNLDWSANNTNWNRIAMRENAAGVWKSEAPIQREEGSNVSLRIIIKGGNGTEYVDETFSYSVAYRPDLYAKGQTIRIGGTTQTLLFVTIANAGGTDSGPFSVVAYDEADGANRKLIGSKATLLSLRAGADTTISLAWSGTVAGEKQVSFSVDIDSLVAESNERNNYSTRSLLIVNAAQGSSGPLYAPEKNLYLTIPANALAQNSLLSFAKKWEPEHAEAAKQSGLEPMKIRGNKQPFLYDIQFADSTTRFSKPIAVAMMYDRTDSTTLRFPDQNALRIYAWNAATSSWRGLPSTIQRDKEAVTASLPVEYTGFALMANGDAEAPLIQISVEGQHFADGDMVSRQPVFTAAIEDASGLDLGSASVTLSLDDAQVAETDYCLYQEPDSKRRATITYAPTLLAGSHRLNVSAADINGNVGNVEVAFTVSGQFELASIANHPNPFVTETTIAFTLTEQAEEVKLGIYTVSGRLLRTFEFFDIAGYMEQEWDGADEDGNQVANGVYFLKFAAKRGDKKIETIEKMAKLE